MGNVIKLGYSEVRSAETDVCVRSAEKIDNNRPRRAKNKVLIIVGEKQINADSEIYYAMRPSENGTLIMQNKTNKTPIFISSQLNIQLFIKT